MLLAVFLAALCVAGAVACGQRSSNLDDFDKIVGGQAAQHGEFPWQASLQRKSLGGKSHFCGGTILDANTVITAAHCVEGLTESYLQVVVGDHRLAGNDGTEQIRLVYRIISHDNYTSYNFANDIAILKLVSPLALNTAYAIPACLPAEDKYAFSGHCTVTGWGSIREGSSITGTLMKVAVPLISDAKCRQQYGTSAIKDHMLCAGYDQGGKDACQGDSGGPLVCVENNRAYLAGIVSWGEGCARPNSAGVYTEVSYFLDWIKKNRHE